MKRVFAITAALIAMIASQSSAQTAGTGEPLKLKQVVSLALQNSRDVTLARIQYQIALNDVRVGQSEFLPNLYTGSGDAYTSGFPSGPGGQPPSVFNLSYTESLINLPFRGQIKAAQKRAENERIELDRTRDDVMVRAASLYLELANVRQSLKLIATERDSQEKIQAMIQERAAAGLELPIEITRSELALARIQQHMVQLDGRDQILSEQLRTMIGVPSDQPIEVETEQLPAIEQPAANETFNLAVQHDPLIKEAENERAAREQIWKGAKGAYWPTVSAIGEYEILTRYNNYQEFYKTFQRNNITLGVEVQIPLFSSKTRSSIALAKSQLQESEILLGNRRQDTRIDVQQHLQSVRELDAAKEVARLDLRLAQETLDLIQGRYDQGRATVSELEQARLDENEKWLAFLDADFARQKEELSVLEMTGQLAKLFQ